MSAVETLSLDLGGRTFEVPRLPLGVTIVVYPLCQRLTNAGLAQRISDAADGKLEISEDEIGDLTELAFQAAHAADPHLETEAFLSLPVTPPELFAAFFIMRIQCGGWRKVASEDGDEPGERKGAQSPISTSSESSPASSDTSTSQPNTG